MASLITPGDLANALPALDPARAEELCADASAYARLKAPCVATLTDTDSLAAVKAILRAAIVYHVQTESGSAQTQTAGPHSYTVDTRGPRSSRMLSPAQIDDLRSLCSPTALPGAYSVQLTR